MYNKNVEWLRYPAFWWLYLGALPFLVLLLGLTVMEGKELAEVLTVTHVIHNTVRSPPPVVVVDATPSSSAATVWPPCYTVR